MNQIFSRVEHARTAQEVVQQVEGLILEGIFRPGDRLPGERELSRSFEVSRPILREALKLLHARGLLVTRHGDGTQVADIVGEVFSQPMLDLIANHGKGTADYLEYRREIEGIAADLAARRATRDDRAMLGAIVERMRAAHAADDFEAEAACDVEFHGAIGECAHNIVLLHTLRSCYRLLADGVFYNRALIYRLAGAREALLEQHLAIAEAVIAGQAAAAQAAARSHIDFVERAIAEADKAEGWRRVSRLRMLHREPSATVGDRGDVH